jgi:FeS assembly SUF system regulator
LNEKGSNVIKLGKLTDYAVVVMAQLAKESGALQSAAQLAAKTGIPEPTVAKVLKQLSKSELAESARGAAGGYRLMKPAGEISAADIITAMDGPIAIVSCVEGVGEHCRSEATCPVRGNWDRANTLIRQALESVRLSEMMVPPCRKQHSFVSFADTRGAHAGGD